MRCAAIPVVHSDGVHRPLVEGLAARREMIQETWVVLLRGEDSSTPLANPETLVHYIPYTLERLFEKLRTTRVAAGTPLIHSYADICTCGANPFIKFFATGEQAVTEALIHVQIDSHQTCGAAAAAEALKWVYRRLAFGEIAGFCEVCVKRDAKCTEWQRRPEIADSSAGALMVGE